MLGLRSTDIDTSCYVPETYPSMLLSCPRLTHYMRRNNEFLLPKEILRELRICIIR